MQSQKRRSLELVEPDRIEPIPDDIDSTQGKLVYLYLEVTGGATIDELGRTLGMQKITLLSVIRSLTSAGLVEKRDGEYVVPS